MQRPGSMCTRALLATLCASTLLAGCGTSPPTRFYTLEAVAPAANAAVAAYSGPPLQVRAVHVPPTWDRIELVREVAPGQLQVREFDEWAAPLGRTARQALTQDLAARLPVGAVLFPEAAQAGDSAELSVDILSIKLDGRSAVMQVAWALRTPSPSPSKPAWRRAALRLQAPLAGDGGDATALALAALLGQLADAIAAEIGK